MRFGAVALFLAGASAFSQSSGQDSLNRSLPKWIGLGAEVRFRSEGSRGPDNQPAGTHDFVLQRTRLSVELRPFTWLKLYGQGQDARSYGLTPVNGVVKDTADIRQAYALIGHEDHWWDLKIGRQVLAYGSERLIGGSDWTNTARVFDALRLSVHHGPDRVDLFSSSVVNNDVDQWDHHQEGNNLHGLYASVGSLLPGAHIEPYVLLRDNHRAGSHSWTTGARLAGSAEAWIYELDLLRQAGKSGPEHLAAWAATVQVQRQFAEWKGTPTLLAEYNYASGDNRPGDGEINTLDQLYPTNHSIYGLADQIGRRNAKNLRAGIGIKLKPWASIRTDVHSFWLADRNDALYMASGAVSVPAVAGGARYTDIGREWDFRADLKMARHYDVGLQYGHLFPGPFLRTYAPAGGRDFYAAYVDFKL